MDNSKLPGFTKKSSETPWSPTHERSKLSDRAGTVKSLTGLPTDPYGDQKSWKGDNTGTTIHGKTKSGDPVKKKKGGFPTGPKSKNEEREY